MKRAVAPNGFSHQWVCEKNKAQVNEIFPYVELSELLHMNGCGLIGIYLHEVNERFGPDKKGEITFLQADAICVKDDGKAHIFRLSFPSKSNGYSDSILGTVWDDIILYAPNHSSQNAMPPTWVAAVHNNQVFELYGTPCDYSEALPVISDIIRDSVDYDYDFLEFKVPPLDALCLVY